MEELILCIAPTAGQYGKILSSRLSDTGGLNFNIIMFNKGNRAFADLRYGEEDSISPSSVAHSRLLIQRANSGYILFMYPLRYSES